MQNQSGLMKETKTQVQKMVKLHMRGHDMVRRVDRQGKVLIWYRKCSGYARQ